MVQSIFSYLADTLFVIPYQLKILIVGNYNRRSDRSQMVEACVLSTELNIDILRLSIYDYLASQYFKKSHPRVRHFYQWISLIGQLIILTHQGFYRQILLASVMGSNFQYSIYFSRFWAAKRPTSCNMEFQLLHRRLTFQSSLNRDHYKVLRLVHLWFI